MKANWKNELGKFMTEHNHYSKKSYYKTILIPLLEELEVEFSRYDDLVVEVIILIFIDDKEDKKK